MVFKFESVRGNDSIINYFIDSTFLSIAHGYMLNGIEENKCEIEVSRTNFLLLRGRFSHLAYLPELQ